MRRREDWPLRLAHFFKAASERSFSWRKNNCALVCADWVLEATGVDPALAFRDQFSDRGGAIRALARHGAGDLVSTATLMLGAPLDNPLCAQRGDIVAIGTDEGPALGICGGDFVAVMTPAMGWGRQPLTGATMAWRV